MSRVWVLIGLLLAACGPSLATAPSDAVAWRGAAVSGDRVHDAIPLLEAAWQQIPRDWNWAPRGWWITWSEAPLPCGEATCGTAPCRTQGYTLCSGLTHPKARRIDLSWASRAPVSAARWELGNARCVDVTGTSPDTGGAC